MAQWTAYGLDEFLETYPKLILKEESSKKLVIEGKYFVNAQMDGFHAVSESIDLRIEFPGGYPNEIPKVFDLGDTIPKDADHHVNGSDKSLCLGSGIKILDEIHSSPSLNSFVQNCINNYLYRILYKKEYGIIPGDELLHGEEGLIQDYQDIFGITGKENVIQLLRVLGCRKRVANKLDCPCGCGFRLGRCDFRFRLPEWRRKSKLSWYREHLRENFTPIPKAKPKGKQKA